MNHNPAFELDIIIDAALLTEEGARVPRLTRTPQDRDGTLAHCFGGGAMHSYFGDFWHVSNGIKHVTLSLEVSVRLDGLLLFDDLTGQGLGLNPTIAALSVPDHAEDVYFILHVIFELRWKSEADHALLMPWIIQRPVIRIMYDIVCGLFTVPLDLKLVMMNSRTW